MVKTSVAVDKPVLEDLMAAYPGISASELIRAALKYLLAKLPDIKTGVQVVDKA